MRPISRVALLLPAFSLVAAFACACRAADPPASGPARKGHLDATFLVTADLHFGARTILTTTQKEDASVTCEDAQKLMIAQMNAIEGQPYPREVGGKASKALGLLIAGDLTDDGDPDEWQSFVALYGLSGKEGLLKMPVFETLGNHDRQPGAAVSKGIIQRHQAEHYSWDAGDLHIVCLGEPNDDDLAFLLKDLPAVGRQRPVVIYFHYSVVGPYSDDYWFGKADHRDRFAAALRGYNVVALFHGHFHGSGCYKWRGYDVYDVGAVKHGSKDFIVLHVTDDRLTVAAWNYEGKPGWWWAHSKPINDAARPGAAETLKVYPHPGAHARPCIPHPLTDSTRLPR
ncbi:MAG: metallophosphoesterase [Phycisphaerae bacterium]|nr:metallophosphoesterase [Phycisphaerae bacterium]